MLSWHQGYIYLMLRPHPPTPHPTPGGGRNKNDFTDARLLNVGKKYDLSNLGKGIKMIKMENIYPWRITKVQGERIKQTITNIFT